MPSKFRKHVLSPLCEVLGAFNWDDSSFNAYANVSGVPLRVPGLYLVSGVGWRTNTYMALCCAEQSRE